MRGTKKAEKRGWGKGFGRFLKDAVGAQMDIGLESFCDRCGGKMVPNKEKSELECRRCLEEAVSQIEASERTVAW